MELAFYICFRKFRQSLEKMLPQHQEKVPEPELEPVRIREWIWVRVDTEYRLWPRRRRHRYRNRYRPLPRPRNLSLRHLRRQKEEGVSISRILARFGESFQRSSLLCQREPFERVLSGDER